MKKKLFIYVLISIFVCPLKAQITKTLKTEKDGFQWYELKENGFEGAESVGGETIVPLSKKYNRVYYFHGYFNVTYKKNTNSKDDIAGIINTQGKEIISTKKGYCEAFFYKNHFQVKKHSESNNITMVGACDIDGNEVIPTIYDAGKNLIIYCSEKDNCEDGYGFIRFDCNELKYKPLNIFLDSKGHAINRLSYDGKEVIDFLFQDFWNFQTNSNVFPLQNRTNNNVNCSQFIIRFELSSSSFVVKIISVDRSSGTETTNESYNINPSSSMLKANSNEILIGFDIQGSKINKNIILQPDKKTIHFIYDIINHGNDIYHIYRNNDMVSYMREDELMKAANGCLGYQDEINYETKYKRLKERLSQYSWKKRNY